MYTLGYAELLRLLDEVNHIGQLLTFKIMLEGSTSERASGNTNSANGVPISATFDGIRTNSLVYEEIERLRALVLTRLQALKGGIEPGVSDRPGQRSPAPKAGNWSDKEIVAILDSAQIALLKHPVAAQAAFAALVAEGRLFAETDSGRQWLEVLKSSELMRKLRWIWETTSLNMLEEDVNTIVPSTYLEALLRAAGTPDMEILLSRIKGMGHE
jgi:hypothetical protein